MSSEVPEQLEVREGSGLTPWVRGLHAIGSSQLLAWMGLTCLFAALPLFYMKNAWLSDPDIWWHMRTGEWILQNHQIPHVDPFSSSTVGRAWVDYSWIFDVGSYWVVSHFDLVGIIWFEMVVRLVVTGAMFSLVRSLTPRFWKAVGITGLAMLAMAWLMPPRPGALSVLFFVLELHVLVSAQRKSNPRLLWILPALFALWANIHIEFVTGLFVLGVFCLEPLLSKLGRHDLAPGTGIDVFHRQLWFVFPASLVAVMVNPYGPKLLSNVFQYAHDTKIYDVIVEFHAMHFRSINDWAVLLLLMLACFALGRARRFRPAWGLVLAWSAWMGFRSLREVWLVAIVSAVLIANARDEEEQAPEKGVAVNLSMRLSVAVTVILVLLTGANLWSLSSKGLLSQVAKIYPLGAVNYIHRNHLRGPLLNELSWGGFLIYAMPEVPPSMDGRTNVHTQDEIMRSFPLWNGASGWQNRSEVLSANLIVSDHSWPLALLLRSDPRFRVAYEDSTSVLFEAVREEKSESRSPPQTR